MTILLTLTVLALISIAIWQITKIFELSQPKKENTQVADDDDNRWNGQLMFAFLIFIYGITLFSFWKWGDVLLPGASSEHGMEYDNLMWISFAIIFFVQTITQALLHYFAYKYRGEKGKKALFYADNDRLEAIWTIIPVIALAGLILYGLYTWTDIMTVEENEDALIVELYAQQFNWKARYAGEDGVLGDANVRFLQDFDGKNLVGIDATDPNGFDDVVVQELHLPTGREVIFKMRSQDVLHSAYMPHFRAQMNCVPGMITEFAFTPTVTTEEMRQTADVKAKVKKINTIRRENSKELIAKGEEALEPYIFDYLLLCNKICGASHYNMQMKIIVETPEEFEKWMTDQQTFAEVIQ
ncbi:MAG: cytochrome c oxidase subunit II [Flavobacteriaceae bacterium]|jgi:cytochrome c oxidase subunit 2|nr:cytochrome c oxidase subunit II [Flavobacteriaceae bacterium]MDG1968207.1 cytochrome c oxidase subunit II [Flavobacteriaceae bacterium]HCZ10361.1 cytochrome C oxidase subunit II [Flavobacteriaceae bacterium]|tara:strand:+ start:81 stop:1145 length:1065 start_codon:yes stop_codon:yes gene_type:complete